MNPISAISGAMSFLGGLFGGGPPTDEQLRDAHYDLTPLGWAPKGAPNAMTLVSAGAPIGGDIYAVVPEAAPSTLSYLGATYQAGSSSQPGSFSLVWVLVGLVLLLWVME